MLPAVPHHEFHSWKWTWSLSVQTWTQERGVTSKPQRFSLMLQKYRELSAQSFSKMSACQFSSTDVSLILQHICRAECGGARQALAAVGETAKRWAVPQPQLEQLGVVWRGLEIQICAEWFWRFWPAIKAIKVTVGRHLGSRLTGSSRRLRCMRSWRSFFCW